MNRQILNEAGRTVKETGINPLCITTGIVKHNYRNVEVQSPILLTPVEVSHDRIKDVVEFILIEDDTIINPFLINHFSENLGLELDPESLDLQLLVESLSSGGIEVDASVRIIGNYHPHRFQVVRELEDLKKSALDSSVLESLFGCLDDTTDGHILELSSSNLFPADTDHEKAFESISRGHTVIQGPPGTGKSQVLGNLLGKLLLNNHSALVLSEKRPALEVLEKRLAFHQLDKLCFIASADRMSSSFLQDLQSTWEYFETSELQQENNLMLSEQLEDNLQLLIDLLRKEELIGGISLYDFKKRLNELEVSSASYSSEVCSIDHFDNIAASLNKIYERKINASIGLLKPSLFAREDFHSLDQKITGWKAQLNEISVLFEVITFSDLDQLMHLAANCQIYENDLYKKYASIFKPNSRTQKKFLKLRKEWKKTTISETQFSENGHWFKPITLAETENLELLFNKPGWLAKRKAKKIWQSYSSLERENALEAIADRKQHLELKNKISHLLVEFCDLGIEDPNIEVDMIYQSLPHYTQDKWKIYTDLSTEKRQLLTSKHTLINNIWSELKSHLILSPDNDINEALENILGDLKHMIDFRADLQEFDQTVFSMIRRNNRLTDLEAELFTSHWTIFCERFPHFAEFEIADIHKKVEEILEANNTEQRTVARQIEYNTQQLFKRYQTLLNTPARKLTDSEKQLKKRLRSGKSLLVKEFKKTRRHLSLRELFHSDASLWINVLKPIWLSNPTQLAKCFPMSRGMFDVCVFDEASQIPLQNALGAIYRSKRIVIAGDDQQMGPSNYFSVGSSEPMDLLHQASFYWERTPLLHHYRSSHPDLIAFSNKHFYENELEAYPTYQCELPLRHHFIENGRFIDRVNPEEAKYISRLVKEALRSTNEIGVVAFSEEQLKCIWDELEPSDQALLSERLDQNNGFFKAVENVQGDECDHLIISFGYGKNENDEFHLRFGPMNTVNGRKRLNVLLTRSRKRIDFVSSVKSSDFKLTDNESINLIKQWLHFIENYSFDDTLVMPHDLDTSCRSNEITITAIHSKLNSAREIVTNQAVLEQRGWKIVYN